ncbi:MAG TPA: hypothetical protein VK190_05005 [Pseudoneobacillus sp.]|nr:hypothetical protein [Pseudoneobacillus sp.]
MLNLNKMNKAELIKLMEEEGMMFSRDLAKKELVKLYEAQVQNPSEEELHMSAEETKIEAVASESALNENSEEVVEMNEAKIEVAQEETKAAAEETISIPKFAEVEVPVVGAWYEFEDGTIRQYEDAFPELPYSAQNPAQEDAQADQNEDANPSDEADKKPEDEKPADATPAAEEETTSKRKVGKGVDWYVNGQLHMNFPSIKAAATYIKETQGLKHMPFTPIMKSIRQGIDWNANSFLFADEAQQKAERAKYVKEETPAAPVANPVAEDVKPTEEVVENPVEEIIEEEIKAEEQTA